ncbi:histidine kinase [Pontibacter sp. 172403-2]|uniref:alpha/beta hydrolase-fold protein n=1 Tax=Pontibacter rufus TaxID=2791028 RepID=UPI0018B00380|nr:alpha/beta hydrolase-fold protein [Pontibacter sp. 172403-2]MBF9251865.1 histidine kinase [Pontibacter sp. 172403-2]
MKRHFLLFLLLIPYSFSALGQSVTFILQSPNLPDTSKVYITGSAPQLGNWNPAGVEMKHTGNHTWQKQLQLPQNSIEYKYTLGSWAQEGTDAAGQPLQNFTINIANDTVIQDEVNNWKIGEKPPVAGGITGTVKYHRNLKGKGIPSRDLVVWLPPDYDTAKNKRYPVLYMHDGQNIFDPATSSFGNEWRIDETADSLIKAGAIEPVIVVGIYNTPDRSDEYTPGKQANAYMNFVVNTVKPLIDQTYRTKSGRKYTATGGSSAGGIVAFMLAWEHPDVFSKAICMSPAFKIEDIDYVDNVLAYQGKKKPLFFYIDNGGIALENKLQPGVDQMLAALKAKGYQEGKDFYWQKAPQARHSETAWAKRMPVALKLLFPMR